jgi:autotransporter-associated beta strand protein
MPSLSGFWNHVSLSLVTSGNSLALSVTDLGPLEAVTGEAFSLTLGNGLWSLNDGNLPSGLSLESSNGLTTISGTPNGAPGTYVFSVIHPAANGSSTVINHRLNLRLGQYWDTNGTVAGLGGSGSWAANHWSATQLGTSSTAAWIQGALANFGGSPGTVTLNASVDVSGLRFFGDRFTVSGASPLNLVSPASILSAQGVRAEVATPISGNAGINKTGPGTVTLSAANTYDGNTKINAGTLQLGSGSWNIAIASGDRHALFLKSDGTVWATGANNSGQLGLGDKDDRSVPTQIAISGVKAIACGYYHSLLLKNDGSLWAMGANSNSQLGLSGREPYVTPEQVLPATRAGEAEITAIAGGTEHSLILRSDGSVWTINGDLILSRDAKAIAAGRGNNFILKTDGTVWAQGNNLPGLFGLGDNYRRDSLTQVASEVSAIAVGDGSCFLVKSDGSLWGAGLNDFGHLGLGDTTNRNRFCQVVSAGVRAVATCRAQTFFIKTDGSLWGMGWGPTLGLNTFENCTLPIQVLSSGVRDAAPQLFDGLILTADGTILKIAFLAAPTPLTDFGAGSTGTLGNTPVTVQGEAVLAFRPGPTPAATDIGSSVTCNSGGTLDLYVAPTAATQDALNLSGALNLSSGHLINLYAPSLPSPGSYTLVRASSITGTPAVPSFSGSWLNSSARLGVFGNSLVLTVIKAAQSLSFASIADQAQNSTLVLSASASSGLAVVFSTTSPIASLNGNTLSFTGTGSVTIVASQAGDEFYEAAPTVSQTFHVSDPLQLQAAAAAMTSSALSAPDQSAEVDAAEAAALPASSALTEAVAGNFEALLRRPASDPEAPNEIIGLLSLSSTGNSASARLLLANQEQPLRLAAGLVEQSGEVMMQANDGALSYRLGLAGNADSTLEVTLQRDGELIAVASDSRRLHEGSVPVSLRGRYELRLQAQSPRDGQPSEAGLAQAMLQDSGRLDLAGRLGDGTTVTSSLNLDAALGCRWMILPYQRANAWLGGQWLLRAPADGGLNWSSQSDDLLWTKDANPQDASFPEGFGPIPMRLQMQR